MEKDGTKLDSRNAEDIKEEIRELSVSYIPQWNYQDKNTDIGGALALVFAGQLADNIKRFNRFPEMAAERLSTILGLSLKAPRPAAAVLSVSLSGSGGEGVVLEKGTRFYGTASEGNRVIFEAGHEIYITDAKIEKIFARDGIYGLVKPVKGRFRVPDLNSDTGFHQEEYNGSTVELSDFNKGCFEEKAVILYHSHMLSEGHTIEMKTDSRELADEIKNRNLKIYYPSENCMAEVEQPEVTGNAIRFVKEKPSVKVRMGKQEMETVVIRSLGKSANTIKVNEILLSTKGKKVSADFVRSGQTDCDIKSFQPFGEELNLYGECFIGCSHCFSRRGAKITLMFRVETKEISMGISEAPKGELPIVKHYYRYSNEEPVKSARADEIILEYNSPMGWKRLRETERYSGILREKSKETVKIEFLCPLDWGSEDEQEILGPVLRIRIVKAENCYRQPCIHHIPVIENLKLEYTYEEKGMLPEFVERIDGLTRKNLTDLLKIHKDVTLFQGYFSEEKELFIGFDKPLGKGIVSLRLQWLSQTEDEVKTEYYYGTKNGFRPLKTLEQADNLQKWGMVLFVPPGDMEKIQMYGGEGYYIKAVPGTEKGRCIISHNVLEVLNINTCREEDYYIDSTEPFLQVQLSAGDIYKADLWVNEMGTYTEEQMKDMAERESDRTYIQRDSAGKTTGFFVRWTEIPGWEMAGEDTRIYVLDRKNNMVTFGDGISGRLPKVTNDTGFRAVIYQSAGSAGNVEAEAITDTALNILYVDRVWNSEPACGGCDTETELSRKKREEDLINSHNRLVTEEDYVREVMSFSSLINQATVIIKNTITYVVILIKEIDIRHGAFKRIAEELKQHILRRSDGTVTEDSLIVCSPTYVEICVEVWVEAKSAGKSHGNENYMEYKEFCREMEEYFDGSTWKIGSIPVKSQIIMKINGIKGRSVIKNVMITAKYEENGVIRECELEDISESPFVAVKSGNHRLHIGEL